MTTSRICVKRYNLPPSDPPIGGRTLYSPSPPSRPHPPPPPPPPPRRRAARASEVPHEATTRQGPSRLQLGPLGILESPPPLPSPSPGAKRKRASCSSRKYVIQFNSNCVNWTLCSLVQLLFIIFMTIVFLIKPLNAFQLEGQQVKLSLVEGINQGTSLTSSTESSKSKSSKLTYLARKNTVANAQMLTNCTRNNSLDSRESLIQQSPWYCDFVVAESLLNPSCGKNCFGCNEKSFVLVSSPSSKSLSTGTSSSSPSSSSSSNLPNEIIHSSTRKVNSPSIKQHPTTSTSRANGLAKSKGKITAAGNSVDEEDADADDKLMNKRKDKCLSKKTVNELCNLSQSERIVYSSSLHLTFCQRYSLQVLTNSSWITANYTTCQLILNSILEQDNLASKLSCQFNSLLARYNCQSGYSVKWKCSACSNTYRDWICATVLPYYHVDDGKFRKPCREFCERVEQRCPYFHPAGGDQYAGEPAFLCTDPQIPFLTPEVPFGPESECYSPCDLSLAKFDIKNSRTQLAAIGTSKVTSPTLKSSFSSSSSSPTRTTTTANDSPKINSLSLMSSPSSEEHDTNIVSAGHCGIIRYEFDDDDHSDYNECFKRATNTQQSTLVSSSIASPDDVNFDDESFPALNSDSKTLSQPLVHDQATAISISVFREDQQNLNNNNNNNNINDNNNNNNQQQQHQPMSRLTSSNDLHSTLNPMLKSDQQEPSEDTDDELDSNALLKKAPDLGNS